MCVCCKIRISERRCKKLKERIKELRNELGLTQQDFAERLGMKRNSIANYETGRNEPIDAVVMLICKTFDVSEEWLRTGEGEMHVKLTPKEELARFTAQLQREDSFRARFVAALEALEPEDWAKIQQFVDMLSSKNKTGPD